VLKDATSFPFEGQGYSEFSERLDKRPCEVGDVERGQVQERAKALNGSDGGVVVRSNLLSLEP
jgi:hypothetical protein